MRIISMIFLLVCYLIITPAKSTAQNAVFFISKLTNNATRVWIPTDQIKNDAVPGDLRYVFSKNDNRFRILYYSSSHSPGWKELINLPWEIKYNAEEAGMSYCVLYIGGEKAIFKFSSDYTILTLRLSKIPNNQTLR